MSRKKTNLAKEITKMRLGTVPNVLRHGSRGEAVDYLRSLGLTVRGSREAVVGKGWYRILAGNRGVGHLITNKSSYVLDGNAETILSIRMLEESL